MGFQCQFKENNLHNRQKSKETGLCCFVMFYIVMLQGSWFVVNETTPYRKCQSFYSTSRVNFLPPQ